jgi:hypothetical protein
MLYGSSKDSAQHVLSKLPRGLGMQIPPKDPEAWCLFLYTEDSSRTASGNGRSYGGDNWL